MVDVDVDGRVDVGVDVDVDTDVLEACSRMPEPHVPRAGSLATLEGRTHELGQGGRMGSLSARREYARTYATLLLYPYQRPHLHLHLYCARRGRFKDLHNAQLTTAV